jgi:hypothetical protein
MGRTLDLSVEGKKKEKYCGAFDSKGHHKGNCSLSSEFSGFSPSLEYKSRSFDFLTYTIE